MEKTIPEKTKKKHNERFVRFFKKKDFGTVVYIGEKIIFMLEGSIEPMTAEAKVHLRSVSLNSFVKEVPAKIALNVFAHLERPKTARLDRETVFFVYDTEKELKASSNTGTVFATAFQKLARKDKEGKLLSMLEANEKKAKKAKRGKK